MNKSFDRIFKKYLDKIYTFDYHGIPVNRDVFLIGSKEFAEKKGKWIEYIEGTAKDHPNNYFDYLHGACRFTSQKVIDIFTEINIRDRFHGVCKKLLEKDFEYCFQFYSAGENPFIIVSQEWFENIKNDNYSTYVMIDIIGIKNYLLKYGIIEKDIIIEYKTAIDNIASKESFYTFTTFTDNIFIKANWQTSSPDYQIEYAPEHMIYLIKKIQEEIFRVFKLDSYAIVTQGIQLFKNDEILQHSVPNHFFIGSVATPFIELFDIENAIKYKIQDNPEFKRNLYLSESFLISLKFNSINIDKDKIGISGTLIDSKSGVCMDSFRAINIEELIGLIKK